MADPEQVGEQSEHKVEDDHTINTNMNCIVDSIGTANQEESSDSYFNLIVCMEQMSFYDEEELKLGVRICESISWNVKCECISRKRFSRTDSEEFQASLAGKVEECQASMVGMTLPDYLSSLKKRVGQKIKIRTAGLTNLFLTPVNNVLKVIRVQQNSAQQIVFVMIDLEDIFTADNGIKYQKWAFRHEETGSYLALQKSHADQWKVALLQISCQNGADTCKSDLPASARCEDVYIDNLNPSTTVPVAPASEEAALRPEWCEFIVEHKDQSKYIIPLALFRHNMCLSYNVRTNECLVDSTDGKTSTLFNFFPS